MTTITHTADGPRFDGMTVGEMIALACQQSATCRTMNAHGRADILDRFAAALRHLSDRVAVLEGQPLTMDGFSPADIKEFKADGGGA